MIRSVKFKLAAFISTAVIVAGVLLEGWHYLKGVNLLLEAAGKRGQTIAGNLAYNTLTPVIGRQWSTLYDPLIDSVLKDPDVLYVRVVALGGKPGDDKVLVSIDGAAIKDASGKALLQVGDLTTAAEGPQTRSLKEGQVVSSRVARSGFRFLNVVAPVISVEGGGVDLGLSGLESAPAPAGPSGASRVEGLVQIGYSLAPAYKEAGTLAASSIGLMLLICGAGIAFAFLIATQFVKPLSAIVAGSRRIAQGDLSQTLEKGADAQDELGELIRSFNQMVLDLRRSRTELDQYNKNLASKVEERTHEVEQAYADLKAREEAQKAYSEVLRTFNEIADVEGVLKEGLHALVDFTGSTVGAVHVWDERDRRFHISATQGLSREALGPFAVGEGFAGRSAAERKTLALTELDENVKWAVRTVAGDMKPSQMIAAPIIYREEVLGVVELATVQKAFPPERRRMIDELAGQFAIALSNVIANERTRQLAQTLQAKGRELEQQNRTLQEQSIALQRQQRELDEKNKDLERASKLKSEFLANMSHELRTPMNSIIGYTDLVLNRVGAEMDPRHKKNLDKVLANAQHLLSLINGILDLSKIEAGKMELFVEEFDLQPLLESTSAMAEVLIKGKAVKLVMKIEPSLPRMKTDKTKLRQIVLNLLSNACKFTEQGSVTLTAESVEGKRKGDANRLLRIEVADTGIGMAEKDIPIIFEEFRQIDGSSTRKYGGTGLGLAIVKKMVNLMGGDITVRSELGAGSTFTIVLPLGEAVAAVAAEAAAAAGQAATQQRMAEREHDRGVLRAEAAEALSQRPRAMPADVPARPTPALAEDDPNRKTVLVVDDEPDSVILVRENLNGQPYRVISAFSADEGLRMAVKTRPFAILLDIMMPDKDGWDLIRELKANPHTAAIPIVILSIVDNKPLGFSLGATDYLLKPVDRDALVQSLHRIALRPVKDVLVVDDDDGVREILEDMLEREGYKVIQARNGVEAIANLGKKAPDLIILDLMMPEMDGFQVVKQLRLNPKWSEIPVLICTAKDLTQAERADLQRSVARIVEKGAATQDVLLGELGTALRGIESQMAMRLARESATKRAAG